MSRLIGMFISLVGLLLPWRLRILFSEILGWITQAIYFTYFGIFNYILKELREEQDKDQNEG